MGYHCSLMGFLLGQSIGNQLQYGFAYWTARDPELPGKFGNAEGVARR